MSSGARAHTELRARLRLCLPGLERSALDRVWSIGDPGGVGDSAYADGLRAAVPVAIEYGLAAIGHGETHESPVPSELLLQARHAARSSVGLDTVLRRYFAGYTLLADALVSEVGAVLRGDEVERLLGRLALRADRLLAAVGAEYTSERESRPGTAEQRLGEQLACLLAGEQVSPALLDYRFDDFHTGLIGEGIGDLDVLREVAAALDRRLLAVRREKRQVWAWLGGRRALDSTGLCSRLDPLLPPGSSLAVGEPGEGLDGWRCTHRQAAAALPVGRRRGDRVVRYADVALLTAVLRDDLLATSLRRSYLEPLAGGRAGGEALLQTLRAYFAAGRNSASAAAALGITRQTVGNRLRAVEQRLGLPLDACCSDLEIALELQEIGS